MKKFWMPVLAVALAVAASAFTDRPGQARLDQKNFTYNLYGQSGQDDPANLNNPNNYTLTGSNGTVPLNCSGSAHRCGVIADDNGSGKPVISTATPVTRD